jgi:hypothetical protein
MGLRFQRHLSLLPGIRVNLSKTGASLSVGHRGAWYTIGPRGQRASVGLPGSGLSWTGYQPWHPHGPERPPTIGHRIAFLAVVCATVLFVGMVIL